MIGKTKESCVMASFMCYWRREGLHVFVRVFAGIDEDHAVVRLQYQAPAGEVDAVVSATLEPL